jgi:hypothetical protein
MVELHRDGLGPFETDPATLAAWQGAQDLERKHVLDVNGTELGRITRCFGEEGAITRCEVTLTHQAERIFDAPQRTAAFPPQWIARVEGDEVRLSKAGEQVVHPEDPSPKERKSDTDGAPDLPRKIR